MNDDAATIDWAIAEIERLASSNIQLKAALQLACDRCNDPEEANYYKEGCSNWVPADFFRELEVDAKRAAQLREAFDVTVTLDAGVAVLRPGNAWWLNGSPVIDRSLSILLNRIVEDGGTDQ
jgi:hypothetical protein